MILGYIDPDDISVKEINGGVRFTGADAVAVIKIIQNLSELKAMIKKAIKNNE